MFLRWSNWFKAATSFGGCYQVSGSIDLREGDATVCGFPPFEALQSPYRVVSPFPSQLSRPFSFCILGADYEDTRAHDQALFDQVLVGVQASKVVGFGYQRQRVLQEISVANEHIIRTQVVSQPFPNALPCQLIASLPFKVKYDEVDSRE